MKTIIQIFGVSIGLIIIIGLAVLLPILYIWALNTLFPALAIPLTFDTWCAAFLLSAVVSGQGLTFSNKK